MKKMCISDTNAPTISFQIYLTLHTYLKIKEDFVFSYYKAFLCDISIVPTLTTHASKLFVEKQSPLKKCFKLKLQLKPDLEQK